MGTIVWATSIQAQLSRARAHGGAERHWGRAWPTVYISGSGCALSLPMSALGCELVCCEAHEPHDTWDLRVCCALVGQENALRRRMAGRQQAAWLHGRSCHPAATQLPPSW